MLVLSRRENERIRVGDSIVVTVVRVAGDRVRLGIEAPASVVVLRGELETRGAAELPPKYRRRSVTPDDRHGESSGGAP